MSEFQEVSPKRYDMNNNTDVPRLKTIAMPNWNVQPKRNISQIHIVSCVFGFNIYIYTYVCVCDTDLLCWQCVI